VADDTLSPDLARNFTIPLEERVRAMGGPPAYVRRKREIEDLEERLMVAIADHEERRAALEDDAAELARLGTLPRGAAKAIERLNDLIDRHNRYYPIEADLRIDPRSGRLIDGTRPWAPRPAVTLADLVAAARRRLRAASP
jgi:hypothetical protein